MILSVHQSVNAFSFAFLLSNINEWCCVFISITFVLLISRNPFRGHVQHLDILMACAWAISHIRLLLATLFVMLAVLSALNGFVEHVLCRSRTFRCVSCLCPSFTLRTHSALVHRSFAKSTIAVQYILLLLMLVSAYHIDITASNADAQCVAFKYYDSLGDLCRYLSCCAWAIAAMLALSHYLEPKSVRFWTRPSHSPVVICAQVPLDLVHQSRASSNSNRSRFALTMFCHSDVAAWR